MPACGRLGQLGGAHRLTGLEALERQLFDELRLVHVPFSRALENCQGFVSAAEIAQQHRSQQIGSGLVGSQLPQPGELGQGLGDEPHAREQAGDGEHRRRMLRLQALGAPGRLEGRDQVAPPLSHLGQPEPGQGRLGRQIAGLLEAVLGDLELARLEGSAGLDEQSVEPLARDLFGDRGQRGGDCE